MTAILTTAGAAHWVSLDAGTTPVLDVGALVIGRGNDTPANGDTVADVTSQVWSSGTVRPMRDHANYENLGRGPDVFTFEFAVPAQEKPWVATNVGLGPVGLAGAGLLLVTGAVDVWASPYYQTLIWVNLGASTASIHWVHQRDEISDAALRSRGARADVMFPGRSGVVMRVGESRERIRKGESLLFVARIYDDLGHPVTLDDLRRVTQRVSAVDRATGRVTALGARDVTRDVQREVERFRAKYRSRGGINMAARLDGRRTNVDSDLIVDYDVVLADDTLRRFRQTVQVS